MEKPKESAGTTLILEEVTFPRKMGSLKRVSRVTSNSKSFGTPDAQIPLYP